MIVIVVDCIHFLHQTLPVSKYSTLLQQSLETNVFSDIIDILLNDYVGMGVACLTELQSLTRVKRFSVALMFLSPSDQASKNWMSILNCGHVFIATSV